MRRSPRSIPRSPWRLKSRRSSRARRLRSGWIAARPLHAGRSSSALGGDEAVARLTGSKAIERFTAAQIRKFAGSDEAAYARTDRIHLVSSFLASLLVGSHAPLEPADASGMNLMDLARSRWAPNALDASAPDLERRLPPIRPSWTIAGRLDQYWQRRHGFPAARVIAWSGDNPSSLVGLGLVDPSQRAISLGTSDTVFGPDRPAVLRRREGGTRVWLSDGGLHGVDVFREWVPRARARPRRVRPRLGRRLDPRCARRRPATAAR